MSAYVVGDETINTVVSYLNMRASGSRDGRHILRPVEELGYDLRDEDDCKKLADDMFNLNCNAVEQRYGEGEAASFRPLNFQYRFHLPRPVYHVLKALECWRYQCCEGNVPETSELYKAMTDLRSNLCIDIVHDLPQYQQAPWD